MEEVDRIIIDSLKNINCPIEDDITSLKQFTPDLAVAAISYCLEVIDPSANFPKQMPGSMSQRLRLASQLVINVQATGFRGDLGYQTILYSNEVEVRRVLMYLIERLPRENSQMTTTETIGYVPRLVKDIEVKMNLALRKPWVPSNILYYGARVDDAMYFPQSFGNGVPLRTENIQKPDTRNSTEYLKTYWVHNLPTVTQQCSKNNLMSSLLFKDNEFSFQEFKLMEIMQSKIMDFNISPVDKVSDVIIQTDNTPIVAEENEIEIKMSQIGQEIENTKQWYKDLQEAFRNEEAKLTQILYVKNKEEDQLKEAISKYNVKSKTLAVLSKDENKSKLKSLVENGNDRLLDLANQWNEVQTPLIEQYRSIKSSLSQQEIKFQEEKDKLHILKNKISELEQEFIEKEQLEKLLLEECDKINKNNNRSSYTRRILEIIGNIKKQDGEIGKILKDTKNVQKEINQISGQLDRSFTLSDALIFKDAKYDEVSRKAYKLLATLHFDCESVIQAVSDLGLIERESRNLQDQMDAEIDKDMSSKLQRVIEDIEELRAERASLMKK